MSQSPEGSRPLCDVDVAMATPWATQECLNPPKGPDLFATKLHVTGYIEITTMSQSPEGSRPLCDKLFLTVVLLPDGSCLNPPKGPDLFATSS